jgi:hypothetical protein
MAQDKNAVPLQAAPSFPAWPGRVTLYAALAVLVALGLGMVLAQTWCARLFSEFGLALPAVTVQILSLPIWGVIPALALWAAGLVIAGRLPGTRRLAFSLNCLSLVLGLILLAVVAIFLYLPLRYLIDGLS